MKGNRKDRKFFNNWQIKFLCLIAAIVIFFFANYIGNQKRTITLPLTVILPSDYNATSVIPDSADLIIQGSEEKIYMIDASKISIYADFSEISAEGVSSVPVSVDTSAFDSFINLDGITFYTSPSNIRIYFEK